MPRLPCTLVIENSSGEPLPGVRFAVEQASEPVPELAYVTGSDGRASVGLPPGDATVRFFTRDGTTQTRVLHVAPEAGREYVVRLVDGANTP